MDTAVIGQYIPGNGYIHKMDPRVKILAVFILIVTTFLLPNTISVASMLLLMIIIIISSGIPFLKMLKGLKSILFLMLFTSILQLCYVQTGQLWLTMEMNMSLYNLIISIGLILIYLFTSKFIKFKFIYFLLLITLSFLLKYYNPLNGINLFKYNIMIYEDGFNKALFIFLRVVIIMFSSSLLTFTTSPNDINNGLEALLKPLKKIKVPVGELSMMLSITLRFIPTLFGETKKIMNAQASRGVDFKESKLKQKINQIVSLLVPMFVISFKRADELANAMETRGYIIGGNRTRIDVMKFRIRDYIAIIFIFGLFAASIVLKVIL